MLKVSYQGCPRFPLKLNEAGVWSLKALMLNNSGDESFS
jgi:hypothetical protein